MCGRLNMQADPRDLAADLGAVYEAYAARPRYNVPPGAVLPIIVSRPNEDGELSTQIRSARWGLVPGWAKDVKIGFRAFNARVETVASKPMFRAAFAARRCVVAVNGYYEWQALAELGETGTAASKARTLKQPWLMHAADDDWLFMAGLYEFKRLSDGERTGEGDPAVYGDWLVSTTIMTCPARGHLAEVHDRMPIMLDRGQVDTWIEPSMAGDAASAALAGLIDGFDPERILRYRVDPAVGNVRNDYESLTAPLPEPA
ncbi:SOS response-associated peptidase [Brevibacterium sp. 50QC2O2]|uniref:SOS response-associated peptidase n=1 Tax=Brevibacterium TaxID=1696 RepID=UPI00211B7909|nr:MULTISPECIES: SOS response-associated peptidase [unclassified Brevibacterium]MCQ9384690.1 SOS response-associated peptidase [Brevibacterium sp. 68QC2CO]MCQ9389276.1 SOS response-associated peptidase [Brevibacterium sp. 50QC2O2]